MLGRTERKVCTDDKRGAKVGGDSKRAKEIWMALSIVRGEERKKERKRNDTGVKERIASM